MSKNLHDEFSIYAFHSDTVQRVDYLKWEVKRLERMMDEQRRARDNFLSVRRDYMSDMKLYKCTITVTPEMVSGMVGKLNYVEQEVLHKFRTLLVTAMRGVDSDFSG